MRRFDAVELLTISGAVALSAFLLGTTYQTTEEARAIAIGGVGVEEVAPLADRYGTRSTNWAEEWIQRDFFQDRREGFFVDVGASDYRSASNTYFLETHLGWSGLAIEPQTRYAEGYRLHRPKTKFLAFFVSDVSDQTVALHVPEDFPYAASSEPSFAAGYQGDGALTIAQVPTVTLNDLLAREGVASIDFMAMDIELHEPQALAGFDIARYRPALVGIEAHRDVRQAILTYFHDHDYVLLGKYVRMDPQNLYFRPR